MKKVLFVCTGNTCRSCMAEALLKLIAESADELNKIKINSAGIFAVEGESASSNAIETMRQFGVDLTKHKARRLKKEIIESAELIFSMTAGHKQYIVEMYPEARDKVHTLKEFAYMDEETGVEGSDISDPYGKSIEVYKACADEIFNVLKKIYKHIKEDTVKSNDS